MNYSINQTIDHFISPMRKKAEGKKAPWAACLSHFRHMEHAPPEFRVAHRIPTCIDYIKIRRS